MTEGRYGSDPDERYRVLDAFKRLIRRNPRSPDELLKSLEGAAHGDLAAGFREPAAQLAEKLSRSRADSHASEDEQRDMEQEILRELRRRSGKEERS